jgi:hypothetical protein
MVTGSPHPGHGLWIETKMISCSSTSLSLHLAGAAQLLLVAAHGHCFNHTSQPDHAICTLQPVTSWTMRLNNCSSALASERCSNQTSCSRLLSVSFKNFNTVSML